MNSTIKAVYGTVNDGLDIIKNEIPTEFKSSLNKRTHTVTIKKDGIKLATVNGSGCLSSGKVFYDITFPTSLVGSPHIPKVIIYSPVIDANERQQLVDFVNSFIQYL